MNLLPLDSFRKVLGFHPFHFWGLADTTLIPVTSACNHLITQYAWQAEDAAGRADIQEAIEAAETLLRDNLNFAVAPRYTEITRQWPTYYDARQTRYGITNANGHRLSVNLNDGYMQAIGVELLTSLGDKAVIYSDEDSDGLDDTFTITFVTALTDPTQIAVYFNASDRLDNEAAGDRWRVLPVKVSIASGTCTIVGRSWLLVKPILYEKIKNADQGAIDPTDSANFVTTLSAYQRTTDPNGELVTNSQAVLLWDTDPCHGWWCMCGDCTGVTYDPADSSGDPAAVGKAVARAGMQNPRMGEVIPASAVRNATSGIWYDQWACTRNPDRVLVRSYAGYPLDANGEVSRKFQTIVTRLAAAELGRPICGCAEANRELYRWQFDLARAAGANDEQYSIGSADLDNPFGTRRGQAWAWKQVRNLRLQRGISF